MDTVSKDEWKERLKRWGIIIAFWLFIMIIFLLILAISHSFQNIEWNLYADIKLIGYTIGASIVCWQINSISVAWSNRKKEYFEKKKSISFYTWILLGILLYTALPIVISLVQAT